VEFEGSGFWVLGFGCGIRGLRVEVLEFGVRGGGFGDKGFRVDN